ncbi:alpha/beta fold hydrolase [Sphingomonas sp. R86520]|uniref:alpha/beta fold hydrolase n=1 Tax=Sphingomonas sp. R86520 TaxID=3093859 RepID=UPI0036D2295F
MKRTGKSLLGGAVLAAVSGIGLSLYSSRVARRAEELVPAEGRFLDVAGARLHYIDVGSGPAIVMVHGLGGQLRNFSYGLVDLLKDEFRVIVVDRPGSGYSTATGAMPSIVAQGAIIADFIQKLGLDRPLLVGHSLGGAISLAVGLDHPHLVRALALIAPLTQPLEKVPESFRGLARIPAGARLAFAQVLGTPLSRLTSARTLEGIFAPEAVPEDFVTRGGGALSVRPIAIAAAAADLAGANDDVTAMAERYAGIDVPTRILFGRQDAILDPAWNGHRTAAVIPGAKIDTIEGGHMVPITAPDACARFVRAAFAAG